THWSVVLEAQGETPAAHKASKYFAELIGDHSTDLPAGKTLHERRRRIWSRNFLRVCSNTEIWTRSVAKRDVYVLIYLFRSNVFSLARSIALPELNGTKAVHISR